MRSFTLERRIIKIFKYSLLLDYFHCKQKNSQFSCYKYSIIANSTFSLTSSYISKLNKVTVAPYYWVSNNRLDKKKFFNRINFL